MYNVYQDVDTQALHATIKNVYDSLLEENKDFFEEVNKLDDYKAKSLIVTSNGYTYDVSVGDVLKSFIGTIKHTSLIESEFSKTMIRFNDEVDKLEERFNEVKDSKMYGIKLNLEKALSRTDRDKVAAIEYINRCKDSLPEYAVKELDAILK